MEIIESGRQLPVNALASWPRTATGMTRPGGAWRSVLYPVLRECPHIPRTFGLCPASTRGGHAAAGLGGRRQSLENCTANMSIFINMSMICISKLLRANGGCLGDYYRRRTWVAAKSHGEPPTWLRPVDVRMGKPGTRNGVSLPPEHIGRVEGTG